MPASSTSGMLWHRFHEQMRSVEWINLISETKRSFDSCNSYKRLGAVYITYMSQIFVGFVSLIYPF